MWQNAVAEATQRDVTPLKWLLAARDAWFERRRHGLRPARGVTAAVHEGTLVILNRSTGLMFLSNRVGARIWEELGKGQGVADVTAALSREYRRPLDVIRTDVEHFIGELRRRNLLCGGGES